MTQSKPSIVFAHGGSTGPTGECVKILVKSPENVVRAAYKGRAAQRAAVVPAPSPALHLYRDPEGVIVEGFADLRRGFAEHPRRLLLLQT